MIIMPSLGTISILCKRDVIGYIDKNQSFGIYFPAGDGLVIAATSRYLLYISLELLSSGVEDEPVWIDEFSYAKWKGKEGTRCSLSKPFFDTSELIANSDEEIQFNTLPLSYSFPYHILEGLSEKGAPQEYHVIYELIMNTLKEYEKHQYPWLLKFREIAKENRYVLYVSRTSALLCALKLIEMCFNNKTTYCDVESVIKIYKLREGSKESWFSLKSDEIIRMYGNSGTDSFGACNLF